MTKRSEHGEELTSDSLARSDSAANFTIELEVETKVNSFDEEEKKDEEEETKEWVRDCVEVVSA